MAFAHTITNHTCGYYCQDGRHAVEAIAMPDIAAEAIMAGYEDYLRAHGWRALSIREAPEANLEAWKKQMGWYWDRELRGYVIGRTAFPKDAVCWLVIIERVDDGEARVDDGKATNAL